MCGSEKDSCFLVWTRGQINPCKDVVHTVGSSLAMTILLVEARAAKTLPWEPRQVSLVRPFSRRQPTGFREDEAAQLRFDFESETARLNAA
jgi:hypothetical protein